MELEDGTLDLLKHVNRQIGESYLKKVTAEFFYDAMNQGIRLAPC